MLWFYINLKVNEKTVIFDFSIFKFNEIDQKTMILLFCLIVRINNFVQIIKIFMKSTQKGQSIPSQPPFSLNIFNQSSRMYSNLYYQCPIHQQRFFSEIMESQFMIQKSNYMQYDLEIFKHQVQLLFFIVTKNFHKLLYLSQFQCKRVDLGKDQVVRIFMSFVLIQNNNQSKAIQILIQEWLKNLTNQKVDELIYLTDFTMLLKHTNNAFLYFNLGMVCSLNPYLILTKIFINSNYLSKTHFIIYINLKQNLIKQLMQALSQQKIAEFKEAFQLFDKDNDNLVDITQLPLLIRSLYQTPTQQQLTQWTGIVDAQKQGRFEFADFLALMASKYKQPQTEDELIEAMNSIFKPKSTSITIKEFRNMMTNLGQKMSDDQLNDLFRELKMQNLESFNFQQFIRTILTK